MAQYNFKNIEDSFIKTASAEFAKYYKDGVVTAQDLQYLQTAITNTIIPMITQSDLSVLYQPVGGNTAAKFDSISDKTVGHSGVEFKIQTIPTSTAKGNSSINEDDYKVIDYFITRVTFGTVRNVKYRNESEMDWSLAGMTGFFETFIGRANAAIRSELDKELTQFLLTSTLSSNIIVNDVEAEIRDKDVFLNQTLPQSIVDLNIQLIEFEQWGMSEASANKVTSLIVRGIDEGMGVLVVSTSMATILRQVETFRAFSPEKLIDSSTSGGIRGIGTYSGYPVIVSKWHRQRGINWSLTATGVYAPITFGLGYVRSVYDRVPGTIGVYKSTLEYRYGFGTVFPLNEITRLSISPKIASVSGSIFVANLTSTTVKFTGTIFSDAAGTKVAPEVTKLEVLDYNGVAVQTVDNFTVKADFSFEVDITGLVESTGYVARLTGKKLSADTTSTLVDTWNFRTAVV